MVGPRGYERPRLIQESLVRQVGRSVQFQARSRPFRFAIFRVRYRRANLQDVRAGRDAVFLLQVGGRGRVNCGVSFPRLSSVGVHFGFFPKGLIMVR